MKRKKETECRKRGKEGEEFIIHSFVSRFMDLSTSSLEPAKPAKKVGFRIYILFHFSTHSSVGVRRTIYFKRDVLKSTVEAAVLTPDNDDERNLRNTDT